MDPVVGLEIGTSKVVALVGDLLEDNTIAVLGKGECISNGVRKGEIVNLELVVPCVRKAVNEAGRTGEVTVNEVVVAITGGHIRGKSYLGVTPIRGANGSVTQEDVDDVEELARAVPLPEDREMLHTINQLYKVDDNAGVTNPFGMVGSKLELSILGLHGSRTHLANLQRVVEGAQVDVQDIVFGGLAAALGVLTPELKRSGVVVIDLGAGTTDYIAYADNVICCGGSLGVGGDHVTNDIVMAFHLSQSRAEQLKREYGMAIVPEKVDAEPLHVHGGVGLTDRTIRLVSLYTVMHARMHETLLKVKKRLDEERVLGRAGSGVVLTGGGAHMRGITNLAESVFGVVCRTARLTGDARMAGGRDAVGPEYATCYGLVDYALRMQTRRSGTGPSFLGNVVRSLFGR